MARALGLWPYKDVFHSAAGSATREVEALLAALSAGPVGIGDAIGEADVDLIRRTCRADGVLVRPDVPVAAIDRGDVRRAGVVGRVARRQRAHAARGRSVGLRGDVQRGVRRPTARPARHARRPRRGPPGRGIGRASSTGERVASTCSPADGAYDVALEPAGWDYRVVAPVLPGRHRGDRRSGVVRVRGRHPDRRRDASDDGGVTVTVLGAEEQVRLVGWSAAPISVRGWSATRDGFDAAPVFDAATGGWEITLTIGDAGWVNVHVRVAV